MWYMVSRRENMYVNIMVYHEQIWKLHMEVLGKMLIYWTMYIVLTHDPGECHKTSPMVWTLVQVMAWRRWSTSH